jgi:hypothetical protein
MNFSTFSSVAGRLLAGVVFIGMQLPQAMADNGRLPAVSSGSYMFAAADTAAKCGGGMGAGNKGGCKMMRMDSNADGKVSRDEFMEGHAAMFEKMDSNGDGVLDAEERRAHKARMREGKPAGKCGGAPAD